MASKRTRANKPEMIHCPYCGEDYSSTYKHCHKLPVKCKIVAKQTAETENGGE